MKTAEEYLESVGVDCDDIDIFKALEGYAEQAYNQAIEDVIENIKLKYSTYWAHGEAHTLTELDKESILKLKK